MDNENRKVYLKTHLKYELYGFFDNNLKFFTREKLRVKEFSVFSYHFISLIKENNEKISLVINITRSNQYYLKYLKAALSKISNDKLVKLVMYLDGCELDIEMLASISEGLSFYPNLESLCFYFHPKIYREIINSNYSTPFFNQLSKMTSLKNLTLNISFSFRKSLIKSTENSKKTIEKQNALKRMTVDLAKKILWIKEENKLIFNALNNLTSLTRLSLTIESGNLDTSILKNSLSKMVNLYYFSMVANKKSFDEIEIINLCSGLKSIGRLIYLNLDLSRNIFSVNSMKSLSEALGSLSNLGVLILNLNHNSIKNSGLISLSSCLEKLKFLSTLKLDLIKNKIMEGGFFHFSNSLSKLTELTELRISLSNNSLDKKDIISLADSISSLEKIKELYININNVNSDGIVNYLLDSSAKLKLLQKVFFNLGNNKAGKGVINFYLPTLLCLDMNLSNNYLTNEKMKHLIFNLSRMTELRELSLDLTNNRIDKDGSFSIAESILNLKKLYKLELILNTNNFGFKGASHFNIIGEMKQLLQLTLYISSYTLSKDGMRALSMSLSKLNLCYLSLDLRKNLMYDEGIIYLSKSIETMTNLNHFELNIGSNSISFEGFEQFCITLGKLVNLHYLVLLVQENLIANKGVLFLSNSLNNLINLQVLKLDLEKNEIENNSVETLCYSIINLSKLEMLIFVLDNLDKSMKNLFDNLYGKNYSDKYEK